MKIKFINHASVIFECGETKILTDPWYTGSVFNNGWDLLVDNDTDINELDFNYLWFSHEHPDHFNVPDVKKISEEKKKSITVLFQKTEDQKVRSFCEGLGLKVLELEHHKEYDLGEASVSCSPVGGFDSWLCVKSDGQTALNLNDCRAETDEELEGLSQKLGDIDVLLTQFGWANWIGNPFGTEARERAKSLLNNRIENQLAILEPKHVIPFASFCWFSHEENGFCNNESITVKDFVNKYNNENVVVLYPEDEWVVGEEVDCSESIEKWTRACEVIKSPKNKTSSVSLGQLQDSFVKMKSKMLECNDWSEILKLKAEEMLEPAVIYLTDLDKHVTFDITNDELSKPRVPREPDITMSSESLDYVMKFAWGRGTLMVNGRFQAAYKTLHRFLRQTHIYYGNNIGKTYPRDITREELSSPKCFVYETIKGK